MTQAFGEAFEQLRLGRGLSAAELARELEEYEGNVSRWRRGGGIDVARVRKIADYFSVDRAWLEELAGYPPGTDERKMVDPDEVAWNALYHQMDPATRSTVVPMVRAAAIQPTQPSTRRRDGSSTPRSGGRRHLDAHTRPGDEPDTYGSVPTVYPVLRATAAYVLSFLKRPSKPSTAWSAA